MTYIAPATGAGSCDTLPLVTARLLDVLAILLLAAAGVAFYMGADAIRTREDLRAIYWMITGVALLRATSGLARADRATAG